jgi:cell division septum initiation protein DivIVA
MKEVNQLHEHYMGFKSQAAELKTRIQIYQSDNELAEQGQRSAKKEVMRLTYQNDELIEKLQYMERRFANLVQRCGAS